MTARPSRPAADRPRPGRRAAGGRRGEMRPRAGRAYWDSAGPCPPRRGAEDQKEEGERRPRRRVRPGALSAARPCGAGSDELVTRRLVQPRRRAGTLPSLQPHSEGSGSRIPLPALACAPVPRCSGGQLACAKPFLSGLALLDMAPRSPQWRVPGRPPARLVTSLSSQGPLVPLSSPLAQVWCPLGPQEAGCWGLALCPWGVNSRG